MNPTVFGRKTMARKKLGANAPNPKTDLMHEKLKRLLDRKRAGRSDQEIAKAAGMSKQSFSRLINGGVPDPRLSTLKAVLDAIGSSLAEFDRS